MTSASNRNKSVKSTFEDDSKVSQSRNQFKRNRFDDRSDVELSRELPDVDSSFVVAHQISGVVKLTKLSALQSNVDKVSNVQLSVDNSKSSAKMLSKSANSKTKSKSSSRDRSKDVGLSKKSSKVALIKLSLSDEFIKSKVKKSSAGKKLTNVDQSKSNNSKKVLKDRKMCKSRSTSLVRKEDRVIKLNKVSCLRPDIASSIGKNSIGDGQENSNKSKMIKHNLHNLKSFNSESISTSANSKKKRRANLKIIVPKLKSKKKLLKMDNKSSTKTRPKKSKK